jgi:hypothetical protein
VRKACTIALVVGALLALPSHPLIHSQASSDRSKYRFQNIAHEVGLSQSSRTWGAAWTDYDGDSDPDLFISRHQWIPWLLRNDGGSFRRVHEHFGRFVDRHSCAWGEANWDGRPDLYCVQGADQGQGTGANQLLINTRRGLFDRARKFGVRDRFGRGRSVNWIDYDTDGDLDLLVGNARRESHPTLMFQRTRGGFSRASVGLPGGLYTRTASWSDWDNDRDPDLFMCRPARPAQAFENRRGVFRVTSINELGARPCLSAAWADYNGDGWTDVSLTSRDHMKILRNSPSGFTRVATVELASGRMSAWLDVENDGDLDLFVVQGNGARGMVVKRKNRPDFVLINNRGSFRRIRKARVRGLRRGNGDTATAVDHDRDGRMDVFVTNGYFESAGRGALLRNRSRAGNWFAIDLKGGFRNPMGLGARLTIETRRIRYQREVTDGVDSRAQSEVGYIVLGIRNARRARLRVEWSSGRTDCVRALRKSVITLRRGKHPC